MTYSKANQRLFAEYRGYVIITRNEGRATELSHILYGTEHITVTQGKKSYRQATRVIDDWNNPK